jgi:diaminopimelate epimerase
MGTSFPKNIQFSKLSGSGNDFIVLDNRGGTFSEIAGDLAQRVCARRYSVGADGLILVQGSEKATIRVRYFNPDGSEFDTCGNGGRCAVRFAYLSGMCGSKLSVETNIGVLEAEVVGESVKLKFVGPSEVRLNQKLTVDGTEIGGDYVRLGDPHFVVGLKEFPTGSIVPLARKIRYHEALKPAGANVHFIDVISRQTIRIRTYEKGVEDETLACGSGCISAAIATFLQKQTEPPITFEPYSGIPLKIHFQPAGNFQGLYLEGDARLIYQGELSAEAWSGFPEQQR